MGTGTAAKDEGAGLLGAQCPLWSLPAAHVSEEQGEAWDPQFFVLSHGNARLECLRSMLSTKGMPPHGGDHLSKMPGAETRAP